ncbi:MAG: DUF4058 family protein [Candidatus Tectomicrobia bacterium]|uniref:DUF4058 family protein n=1 Tax=Tectimicrobiota bacterium TaxID=2528274 RepID=A0A937VXD6_UNCTE|nr:DUF4058 family protein [Candidatus Tectomicrobia bacterium]
MPLLDHFHRPLSLERPWEGIHSTWAAMMATQLNQGQLPDEYVAMPLVTLGGGVQVDVGTFQTEEPQASLPGGVATRLWAPPQAPLSTVVDFVGLDVYEVRVMQHMGGPQLRSAIEIVSPANKDRASHRRAFAVKCAAYLQQGVAVIIIDVVTERTANLHTAIVELLGLACPLAWDTSSSLYAVGYHPVHAAGVQRLDVWPETLAVGAPLPTLPLWLGEDMCLPLALETSYSATCIALRIRV